MLSWFIMTPVVGACLVASAVRFPSIAKAAAPKPEVVERLRRVRATEDLSGLSRSMPPESRERELLDAVLQASSRAQAVAQMNEQLSEIESYLDSGRNVPAAASRIAAFTGLLFGCVELAHGLTSGNGSVWRLAVVFGLVGASAAIGARLLGRRAEDAAQRSRAAWNEVVKALGHRLDDRFAENGALGQSVPDTRFQVPTERRSKRPHARGPIDQG